MSGARHSLLAALAVAAAATATASIAGAAGSPSCLAASGQATLSKAPGAGNRWVSRALAARGGSDESGAAAEGGEAGGVPGAMSEVQIAMSSFNEIVGENLVVVDNAKKGTTQEVSGLGVRAGGYRGLGGGGGGRGV